MSVETIYLDAVQPEELKAAYWKKVQLDELTLERFSKLKTEKEAKLRSFSDQGVRVRIEVRYPKRLSQIYQCVYPESGEVTWDRCEFLDVTPPYQ